MKIINKYISYLLSEDLLRNFKGIFVFSIMIWSGVYFVDLCGRFFLLGPEAWQYINSGPAWVNVVALIAVAPLAETMIMRVEFSVLGKFIKRKSVINVLLSLLWGVMHFQSPSWGVHAIVGFYAFGYIYLSVVEVSVNKAILYVSLMHSIVNVVNVVIGL